MCMTRRQAYWSRTESRTSLGRREPRTCLTLLATPLLRTGRGGMSLSHHNGGVCAPSLTVAIQVALRDDKESPNSPSATMDDSPASLMDASPLYGTAGERGCTRVPTQGCLDSDTCKQRPRPTWSTGPPLSCSKSTSITLWMGTSTFSQRRSTRLQLTHLWVSPRLFTFNGAASGSLSPAMACVSPLPLNQMILMTRRQASLSPCFFSPGWSKIVPLMRCDRDLGDPTSPGHRTVHQPAAGMLRRGSHVLIFVHEHVAGILQREPGHKQKSSKLRRWAVPVTAFANWTQAALCSLDGGPMCEARTSGIAV